MSEHATKVRNFFDRRVAAYDAFYEPASPLHRRFNRIFRKAVYLRRDQTMELAKRYGCWSVLEVGCGSGQNAVWFVRNGADRVTGVDISGEMVDKATKLAALAGVSDQCVFQHNDFLSMAEGPRFDLVVAVGVFDYVEDSRTFLTHMTKFADRVVYVSFPGWNLIRSPLRKIRYALRGCPTHFYRRREIEELFQNVGFGPMGLKPVPSGYLAWANAEGMDGLA